MNAAALYRAGRLDQAIEALGAGLRDNPADASGRTFLFELLCFAGNFDRAEKQLDILARDGTEAEAGALLYRGALHAERIRQAMFEEGGLPQSSIDPPPVSGIINGQPFTALEDADPRIGARLELFVAGQYTWLPLEHVASVIMQPPRRLRDLLWAPVVVQPSERMQELELGEVLMPTLTPGAWRHPDDQVRLGRVTEVEDLADGRTVPVGQKLWLVDGGELPLLELRELTITARE
jgi:type VI secretion system protein ImpE